MKVKNNRFSTRHSATSDLIALFACCLLIPACGKKDSPVHSPSDKKIASREKEVRSFPQSNQNSAKNLNAAGVDELQAIERRIQSADLKDAKLLIAKLEKLAKDLPEQSLQFADSLPPGVKRDLALRTVIASYPADRYEELVSWADTSSLGEDKMLIKLILNPGESGLSIQKAMELRQTVGSPEIKSDLLDYIGTSVGNNPNSTYKDIENISMNIPVEDRSQLIDQYGYGVLYLDPGKALDLIYDRPGAFGPGFVEAASRDAGLKAPNDYQEKIISSASGPGGDEVLRFFVQGWLSNNSMQATEWVVSKLEGHLADVGKVEIAKFLILKGDQDAAKVYIDSIQDKSTAAEFNTN